MLTRFGKTWVDTNKITGVQCDSDPIVPLDTFFIYLEGDSKNCILLLGRDDPEGFKAFKEWLEGQEKPIWMLCPTCRLPRHIKDNFWIQCQNKNCPEHNTAYANPCPKEVKA